MNYSHDRGCRAGHKLDWRAALAPAFRGDERRDRQTGAKLQ